MKKPFTLKILLLIQKSLLFFTLFLFGYSQLYASAKKEEKEEKTIVFAPNLYTNHRSPISGTGPQTSTPTIDTNQAQINASTYWKSIKSSSQSINRSVVIELYRKAGNYSVIHALLKSGVISSTDSIAIGTERSKMHNDALDLLTRSGKFGQKIGVNDFGSGEMNAKSDIDFTLYPGIDDVDGSELVTAYIKHFKNLSGGLKPSIFDLVAHRYEATIPDWRQASSSSEFAATLRKGSKLLKSNSEAYFLEGAYINQIMARSIDPERKTFTWIKGTKDGVTRENVNVIESELPFFFHPECRDRYAFGSAVGNWHFFNHAHDQIDQAKYLLRSLNGSKATLGDRYLSSDFENMTPESQLHLVDRLYGHMFEGLAPDAQRLRRRTILATLLTAVKIRELKKQGDNSLGIEAYQPLIDLEHSTWPKSMPVDDETLLKIAKSHLERYWPRLLVENNIRTSEKRFSDWLSPSIKLGEKFSTLDKNGRQTTIDIDAESIKRLQFSAFFELKDAISLMRQDQIDRIKRANPRAAHDIEILQGIYATETSNRALKRSHRQIDDPVTLTERLQHYENIRKISKSFLDSWNIKIPKRIENLSKHKIPQTVLKSGSAAINVWNRGKIAEDWLQERAIDQLLIMGGGKNYLPALYKYRSDVKAYNERLASPNLLVAADYGTSLVKILDAYVVDGEMSTEVQQVMLMELLTKVPLLGSAINLYQNPLQAGGNIILSQFIPGYGPLNMIIQLGVEGTKLAGHIVFVPLQRDKVLLAYQGYLDPEKAGYFLSGLKERQDSPRPALLLPIAPDKNMPLSERRKKVYHYFYDLVVTQTINKLSEFDYNEEVVAEFFEDARNNPGNQNDQKAARGASHEFSKTEMKVLKKKVKEYVEQWWTATGIFSGYDEILGQRTAGLSDEQFTAKLEELLIKDYYTGKNIHDQEKINKEKKIRESILFESADIAMMAYAIDKKHASREQIQTYDKNGELILADTLNNMPSVKPEIKIWAIPVIPRDKLINPTILPEATSLTSWATVTASEKEHPQPWNIVWQVNNTNKLSVIGKSFSTDISKLKGKKQLKLTATAYDANGKKIITSTLMIPLEITSKDKKEDKTTPLRTATCDSEVRQGANTPETIIIDTDEYEGNATFSWEMYTVKDQMRVYANNRLVHDTGCVSHTGKYEISVKANDKQLKIEVLPNCAEPDSTRWNFRLDCTKEENQYTYVLTEIKVKNINGGTEHKANQLGYLQRRKTAISTEVEMVRCTNCSDHIILGKPVNFKFDVHTRHDYKKYLCSDDGYDKPFIDLYLKMGNSFEDYEVTAIPEKMHFPSCKELGINNKIPFIYPDNYVGPIIDYQPVERVGLTLEDSVYLQADLGFVDVSKNSNNEPIFNYTAKYESKSELKSENKRGYFETDVYSPIWVSINNQMSLKYVLQVDGKPKPISTIPFEMPPEFDKPPLDSTPSNSDNNESSKEPIKSSRKNEPDLPSNGQDKKRNKQAEALHKKAKDLWGKGNLSEAIKTAKKASQTVPNNAKISKIHKGMKSQKKIIDKRLKKVLDNIRKKRLKEAEATLARAAAISTTYPEYTKAKEQLENAKTKAKEYEKRTKQAEGLLKKAREQWKRGALSEAIKTAQKASQLVPKDIKIAKTVTAMQRQKKSMDTALSECDTFIGRGAFKKAESTLKKAERISSNYPPYIKMKDKLKRVKVVDVVGMNKRKAENKLKEIGLKIRIKLGDAAPTKRDGLKVQKSIPKAGTTIKRGSTVTLEVHPPFVDKRTVPSLTGITESEVIKKIKSVGLIPKITKVKASSAAQSGKVSSVKPSPGTEVIAGSTVFVDVFDTYIEKIVVPKVIGMGKKQAAKEIKEVGLKTKISLGSPAYSRSESKRVEKTIPSAGTSVNHGDIVTIIIHSPFVDKRVVPRLKGLTGKEVIKKVKAAGLVPKIKRVKASSSTQSGKVSKIDPYPGTEVIAGSTVYVDIFEDFGGGSGSDPWVDKVVSFTRPPGSSDQGYGADSALGAPTEGKFVAIDKPETIVLAFTDNVVVDGEGKDLKLHEYINGDSQVEVYASADNRRYISLGKTAHSTEYDLANYNLSTIRYVKLVGLADGGAAKGYDLMAIEALNSSPDKITIFVDNVENFGGGKRTVPNIIGLTEQEIINKIKGADLIPKVKKVKASSSKQSGKVSTISPSPGTEVVSGTVVYVDVFESFDSDKDNIVNWPGIKGYWRKWDGVEVRFKDETNGYYEKVLFLKRYHFSVGELGYKVRKTGSDTYDMQIKFRYTNPNAKPYWVKSKLKIIDKNTLMEGNNKKYKWHRIFKSSSSPDNTTIFVDDVEDFGGENTVTVAKCENYNKCLAEMMQEIQQLSLKMASSQGLSFGCKYLGLGQAMVKVSKDANTAGCKIAGNYEQSGEMVKETAKQICTGKTMDFDISKLPACSRLGKKPNVQDQNKPNWDKGCNNGNNTGGAILQWTLRDPPPYSGLTPICSDRNGELWILNNHISQIVKGKRDRFGCYYGSTVKAKNRNYGGTLCRPK